MVLGVFAVEERVASELTLGADGNLVELSDAGGIFFSNPSFRLVVAI